MGRILIIDDDRLNSEMLRDMISNMGHAVICALTAEEGLRIVTAHSFDVVFLDIELPDGNRLMLFPTINATPSAPETVSIALTIDDVPYIL